MATSSPLSIFPRVTVLAPPAGGWSSDAIFFVQQMHLLQQSALDYENGQMLAPVGSAITTLPPSIVNFLLTNGFVLGNGDMQPITYDANALASGWFNTSLDSVGSQFVVTALLATGHLQTEVLALVNAGELVAQSINPGDPSVKVRGDELRTLVSDWNVFVPIPTAPTSPLAPLWIDGTTGTPYYSGVPPLGWVVNPPAIPPHLLTASGNAFFAITFYPITWFSSSSLPPGTVVNVPTTTTGGIGTTPVVGGVGPNTGLGGQIPPAPTQTALPGSPLTVGSRPIIGQIVSSTPVPVLVQSPTAQPLPGVTVTGSADPKVKPDPWVVVGVLVAIVAIIFSLD